MATKPAGSLVEGAMIIYQIDEQTVSLCAWKVMVGDVVEFQVIASKNQGGDWLYVGSAGGSVEFDKAEEVEVFQA